MKVFTILAAFGAFAAASPNQQAIVEETMTLEELHAAAVAEGGGLTIYAGGDVPYQQDGLKNAWKAAFPDVNLTMLIDYSKFHDVRINNQLERNRLVPDIAMLQTLQNFPRWAERGDLVAYKPAGFSQIYDSFKDANGHWMAVMMFSFGLFYDEAELGGLPAPKSPLDLADPAWAGKIISAYPNDDDATLFLYKKYVEKYGWDWLDKMVKNQMEFNRGTNTVNEGVAAKRGKIAGVGGVMALFSSNATSVKSVYGDGVPFLSWGQRLAMFKKARHPAAAKLFLNWMVAKQTQSNTFFWGPVRKDVESPAKGKKFTWDMAESGVEEFPKFMSDRAEVERWRQTMSLYFGEVQGKPSPGWFGTQQ